MNHPNIITIHEIGEGAGTHFIATEFVEGETLVDLPARRRKLADVLEIGTQATAALSAAHAAGIVHRDIYSARFSRSRKRSSGFCFLQLVAISGY